MKPKDILKSALTQINVSPSVCTLCTVNLPSARPPLPLGTRWRNRRSAPSTPSWLFLSACLHDILFLISGLLSSFAIALVKTYLSNIYGPNACTKPSGPDFLAPQLIDCSWKVKTTKVPPKLWDPEQLIRFHIQFFYSEQAELRGSVSGTGLAAALVSCGLQHHTPDCGKFRWALLSPIHFLWMGTRQCYLRFGSFLGMASYFQEARCTWHLG